MTRQAKWGSIISGLSILCICIATLTPDRLASVEQLANACRGWCGDSLLADFIRNILLFIPLGFGLRLRGVPTSRAFLIGSCLSAAVELLQIRVVVGRDASVLDWIANSAGTIVGAVLASCLGTLIRPRRHTAIALAGGAFVTWAGILILGAWGIQPAPSSDAFWGQRTPQLAGFSRFRGELLSGRVNGVELPSARLLSDDPVRLPLRARRVRVEAVVRPAPVPSSTAVAPILRIADADGREILMLGQGGDELVFRLRLRASTLRLETPAFALAGAFRTDTGVDRESLGSSETVSATLDRGRLRLAARRQEALVSREFDMTPAVAWSFFLPWDYWFGPNAGWVSQLWVAAVLIPLGYWTAIIGSPKGVGRAMAALLVLVSTTLAFVPEVFALPQTRASQYLSAAAGLGLGWLVSALVAARA